MYTVFGAAVFLSALAGVKGVASGVFTMPSGSNGWLNLLGLVLISTVLPVFMMNKGIQAVGAPRAAIFGTIEPLLTAILAQVFLNSTMQPIQWLGGALVVASVIVLQIRGSGGSATEAIPAGGGVST